MSNLIAIVKSINLKRIVTVFLVGSLLVISTACSSGNIAQSGGKAYADAAKRATSDTYDQYDANQSYKGGMNGYNDDPRYNAKTTAKTKALIDTAKSSQQDNLGDYVNDISDRAGDQIQQAKRDVPRTIQSNAEEAADYLQDKSENLKDNLSKVPGGAKQVFDEAVDTAQGALNDADRASKRTVKEVKGNFQDLS